MAPKCKSDDAGDSIMPKRSCKVLPLNKNVKVLDLRRKEKKSCAEVAKVCGENKASLCEIVRE